MAIYKTYKCPYCKEALVRNERTYWNDYTLDFGNPIGYCPRCKKPYKTGKDRWKNMKKSRKNIIILKLIISIFLNPFGIMIVLYLLGALISAIISRYSDFEEYLNTNSMVFLYSYLLLFVAMSWFTIKEFVRLIDDNNGSRGIPGW